MKKLLASLALASCAALPAAIPPLGVSTSESDAAPVASVAAAPDAGTLVIEPADGTCKIPAFIFNDAAGPAVIEDVAYGTDDKRQKYDLALPENGKPKALVVIIHGGGWTAGGKRLFRPTIRMLATLGYAAASVGYRLASSDSRAFPTGLGDVRCAIRAVEQRVSAPKAILIGASAGAHLAAMAALTRDAPRFDGDCADHTPLRVDGAALYYAPLAIDRARERYIPIMRQAVDELLYGVRRVAAHEVDEDGGDWLARAEAATPGRYVRPDAPPMLIFQGLEDPIVPPQDARDFAALLANAGVPHLLYEVPGWKHGFPVLMRSAGLEAPSCTLLRFLAQIAAR
ncbi:MAG TPA: alpha/beta hydrolase [Polyangiaceae bacterium]